MKIKFDEIIKFQAVILLDEDSEKTEVLYKNFSPKYIFGMKKSDWDKLNRSEQYNKINEEFMDWKHNELFQSSGWSKA